MCGFMFSVVRVSTRHPRTQREYHKIYAQSQNDWTEITTRWNKNNFKTWHHENLFFKLTKKERRPPSPLSRHFEVPSCMLPANTALLEL